MSACDIGTWQAGFPKFEQRREQRAGLCPDEKASLFQAIDVSSVAGQHLGRCFPFEFRSRKESAKERTAPDFPRWPFANAASVVAQNRAPKLVLALMAVKPRPPTPPTPARLHPPFSPSGTSQLPWETLPPSRHHLSEPASFYGNGEMER